MPYSAIVLTLTAVWRDTETPFVERCRAIEPVIDAYLSPSRSCKESDRLNHGRRLVQAAGLGGALGPHFGAHVVRRTVFHLGHASPRFVAARHLLEQMGQWPNAWHSERQLWHIPVNRGRDEWALQLATGRNAEELARLSLRWQALLPALGAPVQIHASAPLAFAERCRLLAIAHYWSSTFGDAAAHAAAHLLPPLNAGLNSGDDDAQARRIVSIWSKVKLPEYKLNVSEAKRPAVAIWPRGPKRAARAKGQF